MKLFFQQQQVSPLFLEYFLWFSFVLQETSGFSFVPFHADEKALPLQVRWENDLSDYGLDVLRFTVARGKAYTESDLAVSFEYLKHLWNLFKVLYEQEVFESDDV